MIAKTFTSSPMLTEDECAFLVHNPGYTKKDVNEPLPVFSEVRPTLPTGAQENLPKLFTFHGINHDSPLTVWPDSFTVNCAPSPLSVCDIANSEVPWFTKAPFTANLTVKVESRNDSAPAFPSSSAPEDKPPAKPQPLSSAQKRERTLERADACVRAFGHMLHMFHPEDVKLIKVFEGYIRDIVRAPELTPADIGTIQEHVVQAITKVPAVYHHSALANTWRERAELRGEPPMPEGSTHIERGHRYMTRMLDFLLHGSIVDLPELELDTSVFEHPDLEWFRRENFVEFSAALKAFEILCKCYQEEDLPAIRALDEMLQVHIKDEPGRLSQYRQCLLDILDSGILGTQDPSHDRRMMTSRFHDYDPAGLIINCVLHRLVAR